MRLLLLGIGALLLLGGSAAAPAAAFDAELAREKLLPLAAAAYSYWPGQCVKNVFRNASVTKTVDGECGKGVAEWRVCFGFAGVAHDQKAVFLAYR